jgi:antitoxin HicB
MRDQRITNSDLARRLGIHERAVRRTLDPEHASKPVGIQTALAALSKQVAVELRDAA